MERAQHPENQTYLRDREDSQCWRQAIASWKASGESFVAERYALRWTFQRAQAFARSLAGMFQLYNRVLWEQFPYCRRCGGQCCVLHATHVGPFDAIALALLDQAMPELPQRIAATGRDCIYLTARGCAWPAAWRPVKCWSFYCALGEDNNKLVDALVGALERVTLARLPEPLRRYETVRGTPLVAYLGDPVDLAEALNDALLEIFVAPFDDHFPVIGPGSFDSQAGDVAAFVDAGRPGRQADDLPDVPAQVLAFIAEGVEQVQVSPPAVPVELAVAEQVPAEQVPAVDQLLADLESLEWIVLGRPTHEARLLAEMYLRYAGAPAPRAGEQATIWYQMRDHILHLRDNWR